MNLSHMTAVLAAAVLPLAAAAAEPPAPVTLERVQALARQAAAKASLEAVAAREDFARQVAETGGLSLRRMGTRTTFTPGRPQPSEAGLYLLTIGDPTAEDARALNRAQAGFGHFAMNAAQYFANGDGTWKLVSLRLPAHSAPDEEKQAFLEALRRPDVRRAAEDPYQAPDIGRPGDFVEIRRAVPGKELPAPLDALTPEALAGVQAVFRYHADGTMKLLLAQPWDEEERAREVFERITSALGKAGVRAKAEMPAHPWEPLVRGERSPGGVGKVRLASTSEGASADPAPAGETPPEAAAAFTDAAGPTAEPDPEPPATEPLPDSDWSRSRDVGGSVSEKNPSAAEKLSFWDKVRQGALWEDMADEVCRHGQIPVSQTLRIADLLQVQPSFTRSLRRLPAGGQAVVDAVRLRVGLGRSVAVADPGGLPISISGGVEVDGMSFVVRPIKERRACKGLLRLANLADVKLVLPLDADRFREMETGEVWKIPVRLRAWIRPGAGYGFPGGGGGVGVSFGYSREGGMNLTLKRLDKNRLRFRLRLDHAEVLDVAGEASVRIGAADFDRYSRLGEDEFESALGELIGGDAAFRLANRNILKPLSRYLTARFGLLVQWIEGDQALLEFILDPEDKAQMKALEKALSGGDLPVLASLWKGTKSIARSFAGSRVDRKGFKEAAAEYSERLGRPPDFSGTMHYERTQFPLWLKIPILFDYGFSSGRGRERIDDLEGDSGTFRVYRAHRESRLGVFDIPFLGSLVKSDARRSVMAVAHRDDEGREREPVLVYVQQHALTRHNEGSLRDVAAEADAVLRLIGARGSGTNPRTSLPPDVVLGPAAAWEEGAEPRQRYYDRALSALTVVLGGPALREIASASADQLVRAYVNATDDYASELLRAALAAGKVRPDGRVDYDERALAGTPRGDEREWLNDVRMRFEEARAIFKQLGRLKGPAHAQAQVWRDLMTGPYWTWPGYDRVLKVLVQLASPENVSAELVFSADENGKGKPKVHGRYLLNPAVAESGVVSAIGEAVARFSQPSELSD